MSTAAQLDLPTIEAGWEIVTAEDDRKAGKFTAAFIEKNLAKRDAVIEALAQGMSIRRIAAAYEISVNTVLTVKRIHGAKIETEKQRLGLDCFDVARMAVERMRDEMQEMPRAGLAIVAGIMAEKGLLLTGAPTARIEHTHGPTVRSVADYIESLPAVVEVAAERVYEGETNAQKGEIGPGAPVPIMALEATASGSGALPGTALVAAEKGLAVDSQSVVFDVPTEVIAKNGQETGPILPKKEGI